MGIRRSRAVKLDFILQFITYSTQNRIFVILSTCCTLGLILSFQFFKIRILRQILGVETIMPNLLVNFDFCRVWPLPECREFRLGQRQPIKNQSSLKDSALSFLDPKSDGKFEFQRIGSSK